MSDDLLPTLHAVRLLGFAEVGRVAGRARVPRSEAESHLEDLRALGWVSRSEFAGSSGFSLTDLGREADERLLAAELDRTGARDAVAGVHARFLPLNARLQEAVTRWQLRPVGGNTLASIDSCHLVWMQLHEDLLATLGLERGQGA